MRLPALLLVDDRPADVETLTAALGGLDVHLVCAASSDDALRRVLADDVAVVVLDVDMASGADAARAGLKRVWPGTFVSCAKRSNGVVRARISAGSHEADQALLVVRRLIERAEQTSLSAWRESGRGEGAA